MSKIGKTVAGLLESAFVLPQTLFMATNGGLSLAGEFSGVYHGTKIVLEFGYHASLRNACDSLLFYV